MHSWTQVLHCSIFTLYCSLLWYSVKRLQLFLLQVKKIRRGAKTKRPVKSQTAKICSSNEKSTYFAPVSFLSLVNARGEAIARWSAFARQAVSNKVTQVLGGGALGDSLWNTLGEYPEISLGTVRPWINHSSNVFLSSPASGDTMEVTEHYSQIAQASEWRHLIFGRFVPQRVLRSLASKKTSCHVNGVIYGDCPLTLSAMVNCLRDDGPMTVACHFKSRL